LLLRRHSAFSPDFVPVLSLKLNSPLNQSSPWLNNWVFKKEKLIKNWERLPSEGKTFGSLQIQRNSFECFWKQRTETLKEVFFECGFSKKENNLGATFFCEKCFIKMVKAVLQWPFKFSETFCVWCQSRYFQTVFFLKLSLVRTRVSLRQTGSHKKQVGFGCLLLVWTRCLIPQNWSLKQHVLFWYLICVWSPCLIPQSWYLKEHVLFWYLISVWSRCLILKLDL